MLSKAMLREALQALGPLTANAAPVGLPGATVLVAQSLALVTGADATRSLAALAALRQLDPVGDIAAACSSTSCRPRPALTRSTHGALPWNWATHRAA